MSESNDRRAAIGGPDRGDQEAQNLRPEFDFAAAFPSEKQPPPAATVVEARAADPSPLPSVAPLAEAESPGVTVADLLERGVPLEWHEAVAIAQRLCQSVARERGEGAPPRVLDAHAVKITARGDVRVLPGLPGAVPSVREVGRILGALLQDSDAPAQVRLIASQAAFEVPVYESVDELSQALTPFEQPAASRDAIRSAFKRSRDAAYSKPAETLERLRPVPPPAGGAADVLPKPRWADAPPELPPMPPKGRRLAAVVTAAAIVTVIVLASRFPRPDERLASPAASAGPGHEDARRAAPAPRRATAPATAPPADRTLPAAALAEVMNPPTAPTRRPAVETRAVRAPATGAAAVPTIPRAGTAPVAPTLIAPEPPRVGLRRPPAVAAALSREGYDRARGAFERGELETALEEARRAMAILAESADRASPELLDDVRMLLTRVSAADALERERVYTIADPGVIPPAALGRQLPSAPPSDVPQDGVGTLEMLIGPTGEVEAVRLHTPLNRYHERMIVSAAKAWRYRPASKNGRPVRFSLIISIFLPESSDD